MRRDAFAVFYGEEHPQGRLGCVDDLNRIYRSAHEIIDTTQTALRMLLTVEHGESVAPQSDLTKQVIEPARAEAAETPMESAHGDILIVDDSRDNREILARRLERLGYSVHFAQNGRQALSASECASQNSFFSMSTYQKWTASRLSKR